MEFIALLLLPCQINRLISQGKSNITWRRRGLNKYPIMVKLEQRLHYSARPPVVNWRSPAVAKSAYCGRNATDAVIYFYLMVNEMVYSVWKVDSVVSTDLADNPWSLVNKLACLDFPTVPSQLYAFWSKNNLTYHTLSFFFFHLDSQSYQLFSVV